MGAQPSCSEAAFEAFEWRALRAIADFLVDVLLFQWIGSAKTVACLGGYSHVEARILRPM